MGINANESHLLKHLNIQNDLHWSYLKSYQMARNASFGKPYMHNQ
jgi:hypothetical protein